MRRSSPFSAMRLFRWVGGILTVVVFFVLAALAATIITFSTYFPKDNPLNLTPLLPRAESYLAALGVRVTSNRLEMYYENGTIVVRGQDVRVFGADGQLAVVVEAVALDLSRTRMFMGVPAPRRLLADGVTLRVLREADGIRIAGLKVADTEASDETDFGGFVDWLNGMALTLQWGALREAEAKHVTLLLRDDVQLAEWALEGGQFDFSRNSTGEHGTLRADIRRLYGGKEVPVMPVIAVFDHAAGADNATLRARFDNSDINMVADYFPKPVEAMFRKATGRVELGVMLTSGNKLGQPWVTLRLADVTVVPPEGYSKPLVFPEFTVTATYQPSPTDVMTVSALEATTPKGITLKGRGVIQGLSSGAVVPVEDVAPSADVSGTLVEGKLVVSATESVPAEMVEVVSSTLAVDMTLQVDGGKAQDLFDLFPDTAKGFDKTLKWLRPNIQAGTFKNLVVHYNGSPSDFPGCGDQCGVTVTAEIPVNGKVRYVDELAPATTRAAGKFLLAGETIRITVPEVATSSQRGTDLRVAISKLFTPEEPTVIDVGVNLAGPLDDVLREVGKLEKPLPLAADGTHASRLSLHLPLYKGIPTTLAHVELTVSSTLENVMLSRFADLPETNFRAAKGTFGMAGVLATLQATGRLNDQPMQLRWQDDWKTKGAHKMEVDAVGRVPASWLNRHVLDMDGVSLTGVVEVNAKLRENGDVLAFDVTGKGDAAGVSVNPLNWNKREGAPLAFSAKGQTVGSKGELRKLTLDNIALAGSGVDVAGNVTYIPDNLAATRVNLPQFRVGRTDGAVAWDGSTATLRGAAFDLAHLMEDDGTDAPSTLPDLNATVDVGTVYFKNGALRDVKAELLHRDTVWGVGNVNAMAEGTPVRVVETVLGDGRRRLVFNVADLGKLLTLTDVYQNLRGGRLEGELNYDTPRVAGGVFNLRDFELVNPPTLAKLLGLLSLQQLFAGTDTLLFSKAVIPLRLEGPAVYLDKMIADGPSMSLRLDGVYYRNAEQLDMNGRLTPALPFNRLVSKIPLIGTILTGSQDGLVVADFRMKGPSDDPQIEVRPLSVLTPGLLKDIFRSGN